jgi:hypothetical protein
MNRKKISQSTIKRIGFLPVAVRANEGVEPSRWQIPSLQCFKLQELTMCNETTNSQTMKK